MKKTPTVPHRFPVIGAAAQQKDTQENYWAKKPEELCQELHSSPQGLSQVEAEQRLEEGGPNVLKARREVTPLILLLHQFKSPIILILIFATVMSAFLKDFSDAIIILVIVFGSAILSFIQENNAHNAADKLRAQLTIKADVLRDGQKQSISTENIVRGDVVKLSAGSLVPADGVIIEAKDFYVSQSALTGERKSEPGGAH
jgi:Mg2+-importing ATPase